MKKIFALILLSSLTISCTKEAHLGMDDENRNVLTKFMDKKGPAVDKVEHTLLKSAQAAEKKGDYKNAVNFYEQYLNTSKSATNEHVLNYGNSLRLAGKYDRAIKIFDLLLEEEPENTQALEGKALALLAKNEVDEAEELFIEVMALDAARWKTANGLGNIYTMKGNYKEALEYYNLASSLTDERNPTILTNIGLTYTKQKQYKKALGYLQKAAREAEEDNRYQVDMNLAMLYFFNENIDRSEEILRMHLPEPQVFYNLGNFAEKAKKYKMAKSYYNMALNRSPIYYENAYRGLQRLSNKY